MAGPQLALAYVGACRWRRRLRGGARRPWTLAALAVAIASVAAVQLLAFEAAGGAGAPDDETVDAIARFAPLLLPALVAARSWSTPFRVEVADVSWAFTAPGGARALLARAVLLRPIAYAAVGLAGTGAARWWLDRPLADVWKLALLVAAVGLALRLTSFAAHLLAVRTGAARTLRALALLWAAGIVLAATVDLPGGELLALRPLVEPVVAGALQPRELPASGLLLGLAALAAAAAALVAVGRELEEGAAAAARRTARVQERLRRSGAGQLALPAAVMRRRLPSVSAPPALAGERALAFRTLATTRRTVTPGLVAFGVALDLGVPLVLLAVAPSVAWGWAAVGLAGAIAGGAGPLAEELRHLHMRMAPVRPLRALAWLAAVPAAHRVVSVELAWLPVVLAPGVTWSVWFGGVVAIPCLVALAEGAAGLAVAAAEHPALRVALKLGLAAVGALPATAVAAGGAALGWSPALVAALVAAAAAGVSVWCFRRTAACVWPP